MSKVSCSVGQLFGGSARQQMEVTARRPKEVLGPDERLKLVLGEQAQWHQFGGILHLMNILADPEQRLEIAQPALAFLDVGRDHIALALADVAAVALGQLGLDERAFGSLEQVVAEAGIKLGRQRLIAKEEPVFEHGGADREIFAAEPQAVADGAARVAHFQLEIPQHVKRRLDHRLGPGRDLVGCQKQQIDIREGRHFTTAVPPHRDDSEAFAVGGGRVGVHRLDRRAQGRAHEAIGEVGVGKRRGPRLERVGAKGVGDGLAPLGLGGTQMGDHRRARLGCGLPGMRRQQGVEGGLIKDVGARADQSRLRRRHVSQRGHAVSFRVTLLLSFRTLRRQSGRAPG